MNTNATATVAAVNAELKRLGHAERLRRGRGYYYFFGGDAAAWPSSSVYVNDMDCTTVAWWLVEFNTLRSVPAPAAPKRLHPFCNRCGWRMGGQDSWDGARCKCGHSAPVLPTLAESDAQIAAQIVAHIKGQA